MKNHFKYSILITLTLLLTISLAFGQAPPIGQTSQSNPFESIPTVTANLNVGGPSFAGKTQMIDGDLSTSGDFALGAPHLLRPDGNGFRTAWTESPAGAGFLAWNDEVPNGDSTYVFTALNTQFETSTLEDPPAGAIGTITSVRVTVNARRTAGDDQIRLILRLNSVETSSHVTAGIFPASGATAYASYSFTVARPGGGSWSWADIASLEAGVQSFMVGTTFTAVRVTQLYVEVIGPTSGFFEFSTFTASPDPSFTTITFVDLKMKFAVATALADDTYNITYSTDGAIWNTLQPSTSSTFDEGGAPAVMPWAQVAEPIDGTWDWTDISNLRIRVGVTQVGGTWDVRTMSVFEAWATAYSSPTPPMASTTVSVQPPSVLGVAMGRAFFVDVYVQDVVADAGLGLAGYEFTMNFNTTVLTYLEAWSYWPFTDVVITTDETLPTGLLNIVATAAAPTVDTGITGNTPLARVYFTVDQGGSSPLHLSISKIGRPGGIPIVHTVYDGWFASPHFMSNNGGLLPPIPGTNPINTMWHELYPVYSNTWRLTSWIDNGDGYLSASDQIDMEIPGWLYWFHVDTVTTTIHFTFKPDVPPDEGPGKAEPEVPFTEMPTGDPTLTRWHMIYPTYSRMFTITSWTDNGDGNFSPSDQFDFAFDDEGGPDVGPNHWAHLDSVSTDIIISQKGPPEPSVPEFPLGVGALLSLIALAPVIYVWRTRPKKKVA